MFKYEEHDQLVELTIDPSKYICSEKFRDDYLATEFLSKADFLSLDRDRAKVALEKFADAQESCRVTNQRVRDPRLTGRAFELLFSLKRKISQILGSFNPDEFLRSPNWGPGATAAIKRRDASAEIKFAREGGITHDLHDLISPVFQGAYPAWDTFRFKFQAGSKVTTVPKNAKTDRTILIEPGLNLWFQKALGSMIRSRLRRAGIDLDNGWKLHRELAHEGSLTGLLATVDFSAASDTISADLVRELLPPTWYAVLNCCRSKYASLKADRRSVAQIQQLQMFSSMGNGFTFELESLIFFALAQISSGKCEFGERISVFGDDVILPTRSFETFVSDAQLIGFTVNVKKSHAHSVFRESCGGHYFGGLCCKPIYLKGKVAYERKGQKPFLLAGFMPVIKAANKVRRLAFRSSNSYCDARFRSLWQRLRSAWPDSLGSAPLIPDGFGDGGYISNFDEAAPVKLPNCFEGYLATSVITVTKYHKSYDRGTLLARLWPGESASPWTEHRRMYPKIRDLSPASRNTVLKLWFSELKDSVERQNSATRRREVHKIRQIPVPTC